MIPPRWLYLDAAASSARLSASTLTRGSPSRPARRPFVLSVTSWRTRSSGMFRALATRGTWNSAPSGEISGSRPLADVVTRSMGTGREGFSAFNLSTSSLTRSFRALLVGPRLDPPELAALYGADTVLVESAGWRAGGAQGAPAENFFSF